MPQHTHNRYPWEEWFRRRRFIIEQGIDYQCSQSSMSQQLRNAASKRGWAISIIEIPTGFEVEVLARRSGFVPDQEPVNA